MRMPQDAPRENETVYNGLLATCGASTLPKSRSLQTVSFSPSTSPLVDVYGNEASGTRDDHGNPHINDDDDDITNNNINTRAAQRSGALYGSSVWTSEKPTGWYAARRTYRSVAYGTWQVGAARRLLTSATSDYSLSHSDEQTDNQPIINGDSNNNPPSLIVDYIRQNFPKLSAFQYQDIELDLNSTTGGMADRLKQTAEPNYCTLPKDIGGFRAHFHDAMQWKYTVTDAGEAPSTSGDSAFGSGGSPSGGGTHAQTDIHSSMEHSPNQQHQCSTLGSSSAREPPITDYTEMMNVVDDTDYFADGPTLAELAHRKYQNAKETRVRQRSNSPGSGSDRSHKSSGDLCAKELSTASAPHPSQHQHTTTHVHNLLKNLTSFVTLRRRETTNDTKMKHKSRCAHHHNHHHSDDGPTTGSESPRLLAHHRSHSTGNTAIFNVRWPLSNGKDKDVNCNGVAMNGTLPADLKGHHNRAHGPTAALIATKNFFRRKLLTRTAGTTDADHKNTNGTIPSSYRQSDSLPATPNANKKRSLLQQNGDLYMQLYHNNNNIINNSNHNNNNNIQNTSESTGGYGTYDNFILKPAAPLSYNGETSDTDHDTHCDLPELPRVFVEALRLHAQQQQQQQQQQQYENGDNPVNEELTVDDHMESITTTSNDKHNETSHRFTSWDDAMRQLNADLRQIREHDVRILHDFQRLDCALQGAKRDAVMFHKLALANDPVCLDDQALNELADVSQHLYVNGGINKYRQFSQESEGVPL